MKKIDLSAVPSQTGSNYPGPFAEPCSAQSCQRLARFAGLTQFGVNLTTMEPGAWSSQRHWHSHEDEFVWVLDGELTLVTDAGGRHASLKSAPPTRRIAASIRTSTWSPMAAATSIATARRAR